MPRGFLDFGAGRLGTTQSIAVTNASSPITNAFGSQTFGIRISVGLNATVTGLHIRIGDGVQTAVVGDPALSISFPEYFLVSPGQRISAITDSGTATIHVTELTQ